MGNTNTITNTNNSNNTTTTGNTTHNRNITYNGNSQPRYEAPVERKRESFRAHIADNRPSKTPKGGVNVELKLSYALIVATDEVFHHDAEGIQENLEKRGGYLSENIHTLYGEQATPENVISEIENFNEEDMSFLFYYSGHGTGSALSLFADKTLKYSKLFKVLQELKSKKKFVILDCCYASPKSHKVIMKGTIAADQKTAQKFISKASEGSGTVFWFSSKSDQLSLGPSDGSSYSLLTRYIIAGLQLQAQCPFDKSYSCELCKRYKTVVQADQSLIKLSVLKVFVMDHLKEETKKNSHDQNMEVTEIGIDDDFVFALSI